METITWVGIDHYVPEEELAGFYDSLKEGDVVNFELEPENFWDKKAIAVYYLFLMRGHISKDETEQVHLMDEYGKELIGRVTSDIDRDINEVKVLVESVCVERGKENDYPTLNEPVLGMTMNPFVMYEEGSYRQIKHFIEQCVKNINMFSLEDEMIKITLEKIKSAITTYLTIWNCSLSREANELPRYFEKLLLKLSDLSDSIRMFLKPVITDLRKVIKGQAKVERHIQVFENQIKALTDVYSRKQGFFDTFENKYGSDRVFLNKQISLIETWLKELPVGGENTYGVDYGAFVHSLYYKGFKVKDYYMILTHLVLLRKIITMLYPQACNVSIDRLVVRDANFFGKADINELRG